MSKNIKEHLQTATKEALELPGGVGGFILVALAKDASSGNYQGHASCDGPVEIVIELAASIIREMLPRALAKEFRESERTNSTGEVNA